MKEGEKTPKGKLVVLWVLLGVGTLLGVQTFFWGNLQESRDHLRQETISLEAEIALQRKKIQKLKTLKEGITEIQKDLSGRMPALPATLKPKSFRMEAATLAKEQGVIIRLWKPQNSLLPPGEAENVIPIVLKVEGTFPQTVKFLGELMSLYWIQGIDSLAIGKKGGSVNPSIIASEITMLSLTRKGVLQVHELLAI